MISCHTVSKCVLLLLFAALFASPVQAQKRGPEAALDVRSLLNSTASSDPPPAPVRQPGEFEPMEGVLIRYPFGIPYDLIAEMAEDAEVVTIVLNQDEEDLVVTEYDRHNVNLANCSFLHAPSDTHWTRDIGPWFIITGDDEQGIANNLDPWHGAGDDLIPAAYGQSQGIPVFDTGIYHEGGNYMTDGQGISFSLDYLWQCNPSVPHDRIYDAVRDYLGVDTYHVLTDAEYMGGFIHIDCCSKLLSPDKIMVIETPIHNPFHDFLEDLVHLYESTINCYGNPYQVFRVYSEDGEPYANSLILNKKVLLPFMGTDWDDDAVASYEAAMPGYEVLGFFGLQFKNWNQWDALHCRTMGITDRYMLYIEHTPLLDRPPTVLGYPVEAKVVDYSGQGLVNNTPELYWKTDGAWSSMAMSPQGGDDYLAYIPVQPEGAQIRYYIHAEDGSGRSENHPYIGEADPHPFVSTILGSDAGAFSAQEGGTVNLFLGAGQAQGGRNYLILGSITGSSPGLPLPGGLTVLPIHWDSFTDWMVQRLNTPTFQDFIGTLDGDGQAAAQLHFGSIPEKHAGKTITLAFCLEGAPWDFVSNAIEVKVLN